MAWRGRRRPESFSQDTNDTSGIPYQAWSQAHHAIGAGNNAEIVCHNKVTEEPNQRGRDVGLVIPQRFLHQYTVYEFT